MLLLVAGEDTQFINEKVLFMRKQSQIREILTLALIICLLLFGFLGFRFDKQEMNQTGANIVIGLFGTEGCESCREVKEFFQYFQRSRSTQCSQFTQ